MRALVRALVRAGGRPTKGTPMLVSLCDVAVGDLRLAGAVVSLMTQGLEGGAQSGRVAAASSDLARAVEDLEFSVGEGPGTDAFATSRPILTADLQSALVRWPGYVPAAQSVGVLATFAFPMLVGAARFGVLHLHSARVRHLTADDTATSLMLAELATEIVLDTFSPAGGQAPIDAPLLGNSDHRDEIYQAQGMVMIELRISLEEALARMRAHAFASDQDLRALAVDILAGRVRLPRDPDGAS